MLSNGMENDTNNLKQGNLSFYKICFNIVLPKNDAALPQTLDCTNENVDLDAQTY